jgi:tetratricopeptide (TPR) repeat protein
MSSVFDNPSQSDPMRELIKLSRQGYSLLRAEKITEARECFERILKSDAYNAFALAGLADIARKKQEYRKALILYQTCLEHHEDNNYARFGLADCYRGLCDYPNAIVQWRACLECDPDNPSIILHLAETHRTLKEFSPARDYYAKVLDLDAQNEAALRGLGYLYFDARRYDQAAVCWERLADGGTQAASDATVLAMAGDCRRRLAHYDKALHYFRRGLVADPTHFMSLFGSADCCRALRRYAEARTYFNKILETEPHNQSILTRTGDVCVNMGDLESARDYYNRAMVRGADIFALFGLVRLERAAGNLRQACALLRRMRKMYPHNRRVQREIDECRAQAAGTRRKRI